MAADGRPPELGSGATSALITKLFPFKHVSIESMRALPSYDDRNTYFDGLLETPDGSGCEEPFVLKISNRYINTPDIVEGLNAMMLFLSGRGFPCCCPVASRGGSHAIAASESELLGAVAETESEVTYPVRVFRFIPGDVMDKLEKHYLTPELSYSVGDVVGRMDLALQEFTHPAIHERRLEDWDLQYFSTDIKQYIPHLLDEKKRQMANTVVAMFEAHIVPTIPSMKKGVIHNDINGLNIICKTTEESCEVVALIDFCECVHTCCLFELASMLAYSMLEKESPVAFVAPMLRGYWDVFPLSKEEFGCLYYAVIARLCQSAVNGEYRFTQEPWNTYLLTTPAEAWKLIDLLLTLSKEQVEEIWNIT